MWLIVGNPGGLWDCSWGECSVGKCSTEIARCATKGFRAGLLEVRLWKGDFSLRKFFQKEMMLKMRISLFTGDVWLSCIVRLFVACEGGCQMKMDARNIWSHFMQATFLHWCFYRCSGSKEKGGHREVTNQEMKRTQWSNLWDCKTQKKHQLWSLMGIMNGSFLIHLESLMKEFFCCSCATYFF